MNVILIAGSFCFGFAARLLQLSIQASSMAGTTLPFEPFGDMWCLLSSTAYALVFSLTTLAVVQCDKRAGTTFLALFLAGSLLMADFIKPSRFEDGTYLDRAIHIIGVEQSGVFHDQWSVAKTLEAVAKL